MNRFDSSMITDRIREAARELLMKPPPTLNSYDIRRLKGIADGSYKRLDVHWWRRVHGVAHKAVNMAKRAKIAAMADPARNDNEHPRAVAAAMLDKLDRRRRLRRDWRSTIGRWRRCGPAFPRRPRS
jgi:hypothetical protein